MALGTNHGYYKKNDQIIKKRLHIFDIWYKKYLDEGMVPEEAEKEAHKKAVAVK